MDFLYALGTLVLGFALMIFGADRLIKGAVDFAYRLKLSKAFVGAALVGFGTSAPELFASLYGSYRGEGLLAAGNVIGSNIFNSSLVMGVCMLFPLVLTKNERSWKSIFFILLPSLLIFIFLSDLKLSSWEGLLLLVPLPFYILFLLSQPEAEQSSTSAQGSSLLMSLFWANLGIALLYFGASFAIKGSLDISSHFGLSKHFAGAVILAAGTGLPELVTTLIAGLKKELELAYSNIIGSNALNAFAALGLSGIFFPFEVDAKMGHTNAMILLVIAVLLALFAFVKSKVLTKVFAFILLGIYATFFIHTL